MRTRTNADIITVAPIYQVVPRLGTVTGMVRNLIGRHTPVFANILRQGIQVRAEILVWQPTEFAARIAISKRGAPSIVSWYSER